MIAKPRENQEVLNSLNTPTTPAMVEKWLEQGLAGAVPASANKPKQAEDIAQNLNHLFDGSVVIITGAFMDTSLWSPAAQAAMNGNRGESWFKIGGDTEVSVGGNEFAERGSSYGDVKLENTARKPPYEAIRIAGCEKKTYQPDAVVINGEGIWNKIQAALGRPVTCRRPRPAKTERITSTTQLNLGKQLPSKEPAQILYQTWPPAEAEFKYAAMDTRRSFRGFQIITTEEFAQRIFAVMQKDPYMARLVLIDGMRRAGIISENPEGDNKEYNVPNFNTLMDWEQ